MSKILIIEDDENILDLEKDYIEASEMHADGATDGNTGLELALNNEYDLIIVDSTDPFGPGEGLFTKEFYGNCYKALKEDGIMVNQHESPFYDEDAFAMQRAHQRIVKSFPISRVYQAHIPTYPSGHWLFGFASKKRAACLRRWCWPDAACAPFCWSGGGTPPPASGTWRPSRPWHTSCRRAGPRSPSGRTCTNWSSMPSP